MGSDRCEISVKFDQRHKINCQNEENANLKWKELYGFLPEMYKDLQEKLNVISEPDIKKIKDERKIRIPPNVNGLYGLLSTNKEFILEKFGPDIEKYPLPEEEFL